MFNKILESKVLWYLIATLIALLSLIQPVKSQDGYPIAFVETTEKPVDLKYNLGTVIKVEVYDASNGVTLVKKTINLCISGYAIWKDNRPSDYVLRGCQDYKIIFYWSENIMKELAIQITTPKPSKRG